MNYSMHTTFYFDLSNQAMLVYDNESGLSTLRETIPLPDATVIKIQEINGVPHYDISSWDGNDREKWMNRGEKWDIEKIGVNSSGLPVSNTKFSVSEFISIGISDIRIERMGTAGILQRHTVRTDLRQHPVMLEFEPPKKLLMSTFGSLPKETIE
ncbi:MAG: hypothetical protein AAF998_01695 [Bacteroidota bacterium]